MNTGHVLLCPFGAEPMQFTSMTRGADDMTVFVGNLPWQVTEEELRESFAEAGDAIGVRSMPPFFLSCLAHVPLRALCYCNGGSTLRALLARWIGCADVCLQMNR
jgi:RNA recognition motif. (a.k.a. RRM, RBD, or RNP domain)